MRSTKTLSGPRAKRAILAEATRRSNPSGGPSRVLLFNKPYQVLCQFTREGERGCLADYIDVPGVYPAGRLDADSEGLMVLTGDGRLQQRISDPRHKLAKIYWAQVEGLPDEVQLDQLRSGVDLGDYVTRPAAAQVIAEPHGLWPRNPPIRFRQAIPTSWLQLELREGKNRQVRRMTAKVGLPTLRLVRAAIGPWSLNGLQPGEWRWVALRAEDLR